MICLQNTNNKNMGFNLDKTWSDHVSTTVAIDTLYSFKSLSDKNCQTKTTHKNDLVSLANANCPSIALDSFTEKVNFSIHKQISSLVNAYNLELPINIDLDISNDRYSYSEITKSSPSHLISSSLLDNFYNHLNSFCLCDTYLYPTSFFSGYGYYATFEMDPKELKEFERWFKERAFLRSLLKSQLHVKLSIKFPIPFSKDKKGGYVFLTKHIQC